MCEGTLSTNEQPPTIILLVGGWYFNEEREYKEIETLSKKGRRINKKGKSDQKLQGFGHGHQNERNRKQVAALQRHTTWEGNGS